MYKLGFDIYDANYKKVEKYKLDSGKEYLINPVHSDFDLEPGDFLVTGDHVTFYLGGTDGIYSDGFGWGYVRSKFPQRTLFTRGSDNRFYENFWRVYRYIGRDR